MTGDEKRDGLRDLLKAVLAAKKGRKVSARTEFDFVFHMTDWVDDLVNLAQLYRSPDRYSAADARRIVDGLLIHGVGHIVEAARLWDHFSDPFGATSTTKRSPRAKAKAKAARPKGRRSGDGAATAAARREP